jgi:hypothetical protein
MGDAAKIRACVVRKQKTDARDAAHLLELLRQDRFPQIWRPSPAERDLRQLVWHRQKLVWMRTATEIVSRWTSIPIATDAPALRLNASAESLKGFSGPIAWPPTSSTVSSRQSIWFENAIE